MNFRLVDNCEKEDTSDRKQSVTTKWKVLVKTGENQISNSQGITCKIQGAIEYNSNAMKLKCDNMTS